MKQNPGEGKSLSEIFFWVGRGNSTEQNQLGTQRPRPEACHYDSRCGTPIPGVTSSSGADVALGGLRDARAPAGSWCWHLPWHPRCSGGG